MATKAGILGTVVAAIALFAPAPSPAATIGPVLPAPLSNVDFGCLTTCTFAQETLAGRPMTAPFTGMIKRFRIEGAQGTFRLQVLRKRDGGRVKAIRQTGARTVPVPAPEVATFRAHLRIRRGDFIGISTVSERASLAAVDGETPHYCRLFFEPALAVGTAAQPFRNCGDLVLYNARLVR